MLGKKGEAIAARFLQNKGYELLQANFHAQGGEIDLVMKSPESEFVFVEVKTRSNDKFGSAKSAITAEKFKKLLKAGNDYFAKDSQKEEMPYFRIDAILLEVRGQKVFCEHIENIGPDDFENSF